MKTLIASAFVAAAALTAPAVAEVASGPAAAIAHFNASLDSANEQATPRTVEQRAEISSRNGATNGAIAWFNRDKDSANERAMPGTATLVSGGPAYGEAVFDAIATANAEDE